VSASTRFCTSSSSSLHYRLSERNQTKSTHREMKIETQCVRYRNTIHNFSMNLDSYERRKSRIDEGWLILQCFMLLLFLCCVFLLLLPLMANKVVCVGTF